MKHLLILGGTGEAMLLAERLAHRTELKVTTSMAGRTSNPRLPPGDIRIGGFGGVDGLIEYLRAENVWRIVNATHPFAANISRNAIEAAQATGIPLLRLLRPAWTEKLGDQWIHVPDAKAAAELCRHHKKRIFLTLGAKELGLFAKSDAAFFARIVDLPQSSALPGCHFISDRGPFSLQGERTLLRKHGIDLIVAKNSGGDATYAKLQAARELKIPVIMIDRPPGNADRETVTDVESALEWIDTSLNRD